MAICSPDKQINSFLENIGIDPSKTQKVIITIEVNEAVMVEVTQFLTPITDGELITKKYNLVEAE